MPIKAVIFDFGSVIFKIDYWNLYKNHFENKEDWKNFRKNILHGRIRNDFNLGNILPSLEKLAEQHPQYKAPILATYYEYEAMLVGIMPGMEDLLKKLKARNIAIYGLTNWSADTYPKLEKTYPDILNYMDGVLVSGIEGIKKPDPIFFEALLNKYKISPQQSVFIDDKSVNVRTANSLGLGGIVFTNTKNLINTLNKQYNLNL